jgi:hypothetical protein
LEDAVVESLVSFSWKYELSFVLELGDSAGDGALDDPPNTRRKNPGRSLMVLFAVAAELLGFAEIVVVVTVAAGSG